jgi:hypothetical protein
MRRALLLLSVPFVGLALLGTNCEPQPPVIQELLSRAGHAEPHTPGSGAAEEMAATATVQALLGSSPDLNQVTVLRTALPGGEPRAILILVPGFLGSAATFAPLAEQLVLAMNGMLEVWAVDRRPNQLEDRRGSFHAQAEVGGGNPAGILDGYRFYFPGSDIDGDLAPDPAFTLPDASGGSSSYLAMTQDDMRFAAHWGLDTQARDWKILVDAARAQVGPDGLVLFGGHSAGTGFAGVFAAYDFDPGPGVDAAHDAIDGLLLLEGGGPGTGAAVKPTLAQYTAQVAALAAPGGPDVFLSNFQGVLIKELGPAAEVAGLAAFHTPDAPALAQRTPVFALPPFNLIYQAPATSEAIIGLFIDDDFQLVGAFRASVGFTDDGTNFWSVTPDQDGFYLTFANAGLRTWKNYDDPTLPVCPPATFNVSPGCALRSNGPKDAVAPLVWGNEREVTDIEALAKLQFTNGNFAEWYYLAGRQSLDGQYGRDSSSLGDESLLAITQNASMDKPVLAIGGSNGLTPLESAWNGYFGSIATPPADKRAVIIEGYAHLDLLTATDNDTVPIVRDWVSELLLRKLLP